MMFDEQPTPNFEEREQIMQNGIFHAWREYRVNHRIIDFGGTRYDWLKKKGYVNFTPQRWAQFVHTATNQTDIEGVYTIAITGDKKESQIEIATKNLALKAFFDDLIETGTELETILNPNP
jgi:hypothetical protein